jgi:ribokinase
VSYLLGIGHATQDRLVHVDAFPEADQKARVIPLAEDGGGPAATAMVAASRLGVTCRFAGAVGDDDRGRRIQSDLVAEGVDVRALRLRAGARSPASFVVVERSSGRRTIFWDRGDAAAVEPEELAPGLVEDAAALLVDGHQPVAAAAARRARAAGVPVVLDAGSLRPATRELLTLADHAVVSERFAVDRCGAAGESALRALQAEGPRTVVITLGPGGCIGLEGERLVGAGALEVEVVDTNGAGDVFHGAYLVGLIRGLGLEDRLRLAAAVAGLACRSAGPRRGIPSLQEACAAAGLSRESIEEGGGGDASV